MPRDRRSQVDGYLDTPRLVIGACGAFGAVGLIQGLDRDDLMGDGEAAHVLDMMGREIAETGVLGVGSIVASGEWAERAIAMGACSAVLPAWVDGLRAQALEWRRRRLAEVMAEAAGKGEWAEVRELARRLDQEQDRRGRRSQTGDGLARAWLESREKIDGQPRVGTSIAALDHRLGGGLLPGELFVVGARTSVGKSSFLYALAGEAAVRKRIPTLFVSLEVQNYLTAERMARVVERGAFQDRERLAPLVAKLALCGALHLADSILVLEDLEKEVEQAKRADGLMLVVLDYLQLLRTKQRIESRQVEVAAVTRALKQMAIRHNLVVVVAAQLNRAAAGQDAGLHHLRESGAIEQDADLVALLQRPGADDPSVDPSAAVLSVKKNRRGQTGSIDLVWRGDVQRFENKV